MTSKRRLRAALVCLTRERSLTTEALARRERREGDLRARLEIEYNRHRPKAHDKSPSDSPVGMRFGCTGCAYFWPCPTWHALRRIAGDDTEYEVKVFAATSPEATTGGGE